MLSKIAIRFVFEFARHRAGSRGKPVEEMLRESGLRSLPRTFRCTCSLLGE